MRAPLLLAAAASLGAPARAQAPFPGDLPGEEIGGALPASYEPSGAAWHARLQRLLLVDDGGRLTLMDGHGGSVVHLTVPGAPGTDFEGVCVADPESNRVYVGVEQPARVLEVDVDTGALLRAFDLTALDAGAPVNQGLEALEFVPDAALPEGGLFLAGRQSDGRIFAYELPIRSSATSTAATLVASHPSPGGLADLSGLDFDEAAGVLYAIHDGADRLRALDPSGATLLGEWTLPGNDQEGLALRGCQLWIAEDVGPEVWRYEGVFDGAGCPSLFASAQALSLSAGGAVDLLVDPGPAASPGFAFWIFGSASGTAPGIDVAGVLLPLALDPYLLFTASHPGPPPLAGFLGVLGAGGTGEAALLVPPLTSPALAGLTLHHAFLAGPSLAAGPALASQAVPLALVP
jgi:hypothetical protein